MSERATIAITNSVNQSVTQSVSQFNFSVRQGICATASQSVSFATSEYIYFFN